MPPEFSSSQKAVSAFTFGKALKDARLAQGLTLQQVAAETRIRADYLGALEEGDLNALPERPFTRSFLQQYARELKVDPEPLLAELDRIMPAAANVNYNNLNVNRERRSRPVSSPQNNAALLPLLLGGLLLLIGGGYLATRGKTDATTAKPPPMTEPAQPKSVNLSVTSTPEGAKVFLDNRELGRAPIRSFPVEPRKGAVLRVEYAGRLSFKQQVDLRTGRNLSVRLMPIGLGPSVMTDVATGQVQNSLPVPPPAAPPVPIKGVALTFTGESWLRVTAPNGQILFQGTVPAGTTKTYDNGVLVRAGNAGAVRVSVDGGNAEVMGAAGQALTRRY